MEGVVIIAETEKDLAFIKQFATKNGYQYIVIDERKIKLVSGKASSYSINEEVQASVVNEDTAVYGSVAEEEEKLIINLKNDDESEQIRKILTSMNISFQSESEYAFNKQMQARESLAEAAKNWPSYDLSIDEIAAMTKEARNERNAGNKNKGNH